jgi:CheY-like chemotaxis protein
MTDRVSVLVIEDETLIRFDVVAQLEEASLDVFEPRNAAEAIEILNDTPRIRLLFTDIDMPGPMDGPKLSAAVRHRWPPVKIL